MKVFIADPGITGYRNEINVDTSKRIDQIYYKSDLGMVCAAYCWKLESKQAVIDLFDRHNAEKAALADKQYKELMTLRAEHGV